MSYETYFDRYNELCATYKIKFGTHDLAPVDATLSERKRIIEQRLPEFDVVVERVGTGYAHTKYQVLRNAPKLSNRDLAIICDRGNLCFGYRMEGGCICVHTD